MARPTTTTAPATAAYTVLRPICMDGERVEIGGTVELTATQYAELKTAGKVGPLEEPAEPAKATAKSTGKDKADPTPDKAAPPGDHKDNEEPANVSV